MVEETHLKDKQDQKYCLKTKCVFQLLKDQGKIENFAIQKKSILSMVICEINNVPFAVEAKVFVFQIFF